MAKKLFDKNNKYGEKSSREGIPNKKTSNFGQKLSDEMLPYFDNGEFSKDFKALTPKERLEIAAKFMPYLAPKLQSTTITMDDENKPQTVIIDFKNASIDELTKLINTADKDGSD